MTDNEDRNTKVDIEYCKVCDYKGHCLELAEKIKTSIPNAAVSCKQGRRGSFEVIINDKLVYSKLQTMALPDYEEVVEVVGEASLGAEPRRIKGEQPINCAIS
ncbi:migration and invasion enhancer 1 [Danaus plexippus]|uniref:Migration and invasion enhancer 1 n=1 Tax=Danaus plexippus plexippus TaxID=278856 RepID=A0A212FC68_DANPL|nr:migration and invasion enhancer 1 [Danaus plexippus]XP_032512685.1 migration and invasion enhancer 1 [Danaus plexippus]XP_061377556.1 migration and invasion enhancer 1 [Danaus plexippus]XP_061377557.1 migration and invasion enhancer 1 [Danaus plexippus]OWR51339.1 hypothetical protein KGM_211283 [Danaus plexippus plexippus]